MEIIIGPRILSDWPILGNPAGTVGICYEIYSREDHFGYSFIFKNGKYDGFSPEEVTKFLFVLDHAPLVYYFENVRKLEEDFKNGHFSRFLE